MSPLTYLKNLAHLNSIWSVKIIFYQNCSNLKQHCWSWQKPTQNWFSSKPIFIPIVQQQVLDVYSMLIKFQVNLSVFESLNPCLKTVISYFHFLDRFDNSQFFSSSCPILRWIWLRIPTRLYFHSDLLSILVILCILPI